MYAPINMYMYACMHIQVRLCMCLISWIKWHIRAHIRTQMHGKAMLAYIFSNMYTHMYRHVCICMYTCSGYFIYICVSACTYVW